jgi:hypothetical protein
MLGLIWRADASNRPSLWRPRVFQQNQPEADMGRTSALTGKSDVPVGERISLPDPIGTSRAVKCGSLAKAERSLGFLFPASNRVSRTSSARSAGSIPARGTTLVSFKKLAPPVGAFSISKGPYWHHVGMRLGIATIRIAAPKLLPRNSAEAPPLTCPKDQGNTHEPAEHHLQRDRSSSCRGRPLPL